MPITAVDLQDKRDRPKRLQTHYAAPMLTAFQYRMHVRRPSIASTAAQEREGRAQDWQTAPPVGQKKPEAAECA